MHRAIWVSVLLAGCTAEQTCGLGNSCDWRISREWPDASVTLTSAALEAEAGVGAVEARGDVPQMPRLSLPTATARSVATAPPAADVLPPAPAPDAGDAAAPDVITDAGSSTAQPEDAPSSASSATRATRSSSGQVQTPAADPLTEGTRVLPRGYVLSEAGAGPFSQ